MRIGLGDSAALAVLPGRDRREFFAPAGEDVAVMFLQMGIFARAELFPLAFGDARAGLLQQALHVLCPGITVSLHDEGQLSQKVRATQAMPTVSIGEIGPPAVMNDDP